MKIISRNLFFAPFLNSINGVQVFSEYFLNNNHSKFIVISYFNNSFYLLGKNKFIKINLFRLLKYIYNINHIYISCWHSNFSIFLILISKILGKKIIFISHGVSLIGYNLLSIKEIIRTLIGIFYFFIIILCSLFISKIIVVSPKYIIDKKRFIDIFVYKLLRIPYEKYSFDNYSNFVKNKTKVNNRLNIKKPISFIGYYSTIKNQLLFIKIAENFPNESFVILGNKFGRYYDKCYQYIKLNNISNVFLLDNNDYDTQSLIIDSKCIISCSLSESFGLVLYEANIFNIPVISTPTGIAIDINAKLANNLEQFCDHLYQILKNDRS